MHSSHRLSSSLSPAASRRADASAALVEVNATSSTSSRSPTANSLHVPPPEQAWSGAALARALGSLAAPSDANAYDTRDGVGVRNGGSEAGNSAAAAAAAATTSTATTPTAPAPSFFNLPYNAVEGRPTLSFAALLPTPLPVLPSAPRPTPHEGTAAPSPTLHPPHQRSNDTVPPLVRRFSNSSFPSVSASRATAPGMGVDHSSATAAHAENSSQRRLHRLPGSPTVPSPTSAAHSPSSSTSNSRARRHGGKGEAGAAAASSPVAQKSRPAAPSSFADLFVGLARPRRYQQRRRQRQMEEAQRQQQQQQQQQLGHYRRHAHHRRRATQVSGGADDDDAGDDASTSPPSSMMSSPSVSTGRRAGASLFSQDAVLSDDGGGGGLDWSYDVEEENESTLDAAEDEDGANTPTVYRSAELPHWWRGLATPDPGTIVNLRPDTRRLEFWWIDRLGSEAYEIISIVLRHNIEGMVLRHSGESAVLVEFRIPSRYLGTSSYAVERPASPSPPSPAPPAVVNAAAPLSPSQLSAPKSVKPQPQHQPQQLEDEEDEHATAAAVLPAPLPLRSRPVSHATSPTSAFPPTGDIAVASLVVPASPTGNQMETSALSLGRGGGGGGGGGGSSSPFLSSGDGVVGGTVGTAFSSSQSVLMDELLPSPQATRLPGVVRLSASSHVESLGHATPTATTTANTTVNTTATAATTVTTLVTSLAGTREGQLLSHLRYPTTPRRSDATASVAMDGGGGDLDPATSAVSAPSTPGAQPSFSLAIGSTTATVAGRSTDSSGEQDVQWRAIARVLDTAVGRHQQQQPSSSQHQPLPPQQQGSLSSPPIVLAASYSTDAAVAALLAATTTDGGRDGACGGGGAAAAAVPALRRLLQSEASLGPGEGDRLDAAAATSMSVVTPPDLAHRLPRSPSAPPRSASPPRHHLPLPRMRCGKHRGSAAANSANAAAAAAAAAGLGGGTAASPPSSAALGVSVPSRSNRPSSTPSPTRFARGASRDRDGLGGGSAQQQQHCPAHPRQQQQRLPPLVGNDAAFLVQVGPPLPARDPPARSISVGAAAAPTIVSVSLGGTMSDNNCLSIVSRQPSGEGSLRAHGQLRAVQPHPRAAHRQLPLIAATSPHTQSCPIHRHRQHPLGNSVSASLSTNHDTVAETAAAAAVAVRLDDSTAAEANRNVPLPEFSRSALLSQPPPTELDADDDSVVAVLTLPASVCTPIVVVRLHAMGVLHPLLRTLSLPHGPGLFSGSSSDDLRAADDADNDGLEEALVTAAHMSRLSPPSSTAGEGKGVDHAAAVRVLSEAIDEHLARHPEDSPAHVTELTEEEKVEAEEPERGEKRASAAAALSAPLRRRDLSILYTVRSHVLFHSSSTSLQASLQDAEAALRCCATHSRINATYEILGANLISFGYTSQVEGLAGHLRHRWRFASPLLVRFGRVTQVMVTYAAMFLRRQLPLSTLRLCSGGHGFAAQPHSNASSIIYPGGGGFAGASFMTMSVSAYSPKGPGAVNGAGALSEAGTGNLSVAPHALAVPSVTTTTGAGDPRDLGASASAAVAAGEVGTFNAVLLAHALPFEVCPLLLGHYGRTLHNAQESQGSSQQPLPLVKSPLSKSTDSTATAVTAAPAPGHSRPHSPAHKSSPDPLRRRPQRAFRPSADVCHRRLFLLETIYPSMNPIPVSRLKSVLPLPLARRLQGRRSPRSTSLTSPGRTPRISNSSGGGSGVSGGGGGGGRTSPARSRAVVVPTATSKKDRKVRAEDFMYDRDSMLALLAATADTTMRWGTAPMRYFARHIRLSATRRITKGETLLMERPALLMPFWPLLPPRQTTTTTTTPFSATAGGSASESAAAAVAAPQCCAQCGRQRLARFIPCPGGCGSVYCSEQCRHLALRTYHIVECSAAPPDPHDPRVRERGDDDATRMRRAAAALREVLADWDTYLYHLARWDTPNTRRRTASPPLPAATPSSSASVTPEASPVAPFPGGELPRGAASAHPGPSQPQPSHARASARRGQAPIAPPPILAVTAMRAVARVGAMLMCLVLPVELLPQMREHPEWAAERHAMLRAVARTLRQCGLVVPATTDATRAQGGPYRDANKYCTNVDPHYLLLMEVLLQQLSIPFFADFNYRAPSTVWERLGCIPCQVDHSGADGDCLDSTVKSVLGTRPNERRSQPGPFSSAPYPANANQPPQQRNWLTELTPLQREELLCDLHSMVSRVYMVIAEELGDVRALPHCSTQDEENEHGEGGLEHGLPGRWNCVDLFGYLTSTRAFQQISDFCLTSWAVVYPRDLEPPNVAAAMAADGRSVSPVAGSFAAAFSTPTAAAAGEDRSPHNANAPGPFPSHRPGGIRRSTDNVATAANDLSHYSQGEASTTLAVPLAVISPWACLTVDLHPILGNVPGGVLYSRFMVEHEQRRRMLAYCAAAAGRRGRRAGSLLGSFGGANDDSFLSVNSAVSTSAAALLSGEDSLRGGASMREDGNLQLLEEAAQRSCSNLHFSLVYTPSNEVALVVTAKKNINLGDVLWWESVSCSEYLAALL